MSGRSPPDVHAKLPVRWTPLQISSQIIGTPRRRRRRRRGGRRRGEPRERSQSAVAARRRRRRWRCRPRRARRRRRQRPRRRHPAQVDGRKLAEVSLRVCWKTAEDEKAARVQLPWKEPRSSTTDIGGGGASRTGRVARPPRAVSASESARSIACARAQAEHAAAASPSAARARARSAAPPRRSCARTAAQRPTCRQEPSSASTDAGGWCQRCSSRRSGWRRGLRLTGIRAPELQIAAFEEVYEGARSGMYAFGNFSVRRPR